MADRDKKELNEDLETDCADENTYWPTLEQYDPHITTEQWKVMLSDRTVITEKCLTMLKHMIVTRHSNQAVFVCDAKWKILADQKRNYGISQADMYQMYVYQKKYDAQSVTLIYPLTDEISNPRIDFQSDNGVTVHVRFVDLFDVRNCIAAIANEFKE